MDAEPGFFAQPKNSLASSLFDRVCVKMIRLAP